MIDWNRQMRDAIHAYRTIAQIRQTICPNCQDELEDVAAAIALDGLLNELFPGYGDRHWCSTACLVEWMQDRAWDVAEAHGHCVAVQA